MNRPTWTVAALLLTGASLLIYTEARGQFGKKRPDFDKKGGFGPGGFGPGTQVRKLVAKYDEDGDGRLNADERKAARLAMKKERETKGGPGGFRPGPFGRGGNLTRPVMQALDTDKDGKITKAELVAGVKKFFGTADKGAKGSLSEEQLANALTAIIPAQQGGFPGGTFGPPPPPGQILADPVKDQLDLTAKQKKDLDALQKEVDTKLAKILTPSQQRALKQMRDRPGRPGGFGPGGPIIVGPGGFGRPGGPSGRPVADAIMRRADATRAGKVTQAHLVAAAEALFEELDKNDDGKLDEAEITIGVGLLSPGGGFGGQREPARPGPKVKQEDAKNHRGMPLFEASVLRTLFIEFDDKKGWEQELEDFKGSDVEVPARVWVDGKRYLNVGVHFRGMSSFGMVSAGSKRSLNLSFDFVKKSQRLYGHKTLNLLNGADDPSFLHTILFSHVAGQYVPTPKANLVKVVINGESWGIFVSVQQFNKEMVKEHFKTTSGTRWKIRGSPGGRGGLEYFGDDVADYKRVFQMKGEDNPKAWKALINLCKVLNTTPADKLEAALKPIMDIDNFLRFLALDIALINNDGYWTRASDYCLYLDPKGKFHILPHDMNETFMPAMSFGGPGGGGMGGPPSSGVDLDPLTGLTDARKPLRSKLLAVPALKERYLKFVKTIAEDQLDWKKLGPIVANYRKLVEKEIEADTRKLYSFAAFQKATSDKAEEGGTGPRRELNLRAFVEKRREYLLGHEAIKKLKKEQAE